MWVEDNQIQVLIKYTFLHIQLISAVGLEMLQVVIFNIIFKLLHCVSEEIFYEGMVCDKD